MGIIEKCKIHNCNKNKYVKGLCNSHYLKQRIYGDPTAGSQYMYIKGKGPTSCTAIKCQISGRLTKGLCSKHYKRLLKNKNVNEDSTRDNRYAIILSNYLKIPLGVNAKQGYAKLDLEYQYLENMKWTLGSTGYAMASIRGKRLRMHHFIVGKPKKGLVTDHKNRDKLDNRKKNLHHVTYSENNLNKDRVKI